jgi:hypothetical protein
VDPLTIAGTFATIVGLLSNYKAERSGGRLDEFIVWLKERHQEQLASSIENSAELSTTITSILAINHEELVKRLSSMNEEIVRIGSKIEGFAELAQFLQPAPILSKQARSVLKQIVASGAKFVLEHKLSTGKPTEYVYIDGAVGHVVVEEPQFIAEDLETLITSGLLRMEFTSKGGKKYLYTRAGAEFALSDA